MRSLARSEIPRVLVAERARAIASVVPGDPPWWRERGDPITAFHVRVCNGLVADGWRVEDAALVLAVCAVGRDVGPRAARQAARAIVIEEQRTGRPVVIV